MGGKLAVPADPFPGGGVTSDLARGVWVQIGVEGDGYSTGTTGVVLGPELRLPRPDLRLRADDCEPLGRTP